MMKQIGRRLTNADNLLASIALVLIITVSVVGVFMRFIVGEPLQWTEEITLALFVWFTFLGASVVVKEDGHVSIDFFVSRLSPSLQRLAFWFRTAVVLGLNIFVFVYLGIQLTMLAADKITPVLRISYIFIDVAVLLSGLFATWHILSRALKSAKQERNRISSEENHDFQAESRKEAKA